jgi:hypothetical protein
MTTTEGTTAPADNASTATQTTESLPLDMYSAAHVLAKQATAPAPAAAPAPATPAATADTVSGAAADPAASDAAASLEASITAALAQELQAKPTVVKDAGPDVRSIAKLSMEDIEKALAEGKDVSTPAATPADALTGDTVAGAEDDEGDSPATPTDPKAPMIPKGRFDQVLTKSKQAEEAANKLAGDKQKLEQELAYYKGLAEGRTPDKKGDAPPVDPIKEIETSLQRLERDHEEAVLKIATEFDEGKITMVEAEKRKGTVNRNRATIERNLHAMMDKAHAEAHQPDPEVVAQTIQADPVLQDNTQKLMETNPWLKSLTKDATDLLYNVALERMNREGIANEPTPQATWKLRVFMYEAGKSLGFDKLPAPAAPASTTSQDADPNATAITADQRKAKLALAAQHPPAPNVGGTTSLGTDAASSVVNNKQASVRDLAMLPAETLEKMLVGSQLG